MIKPLLIYLRRQPKSVREQIALVLAGGFTFLVFAFWAVTVPDRFNVENSSQTADILPSFTDALDKARESVPPPPTLPGAVSEPEPNAPIVFTTTTTVSTTPAAVAPRPVTPAPPPRTIRIATTSASSTQP